MKKVLISATLLIGMMASAMVFSSFTTPKENVKVLTSQTNLREEGWRRVGIYIGKTDNGGESVRFSVWEKEGMCGAYYWTTNESTEKNPDEAFKKYTGKLMLSSDKKWYAAYNGKKYYIDL